MTSPAQQMHEPAVDTPVVTADGEQFGYVKEVQGGYFKIDVSMQPDYWLSTFYIANATMDRVTLKLRKDEVDEHRLSAPGAENQNADHIVSDAQALEQRERMERELEAQRERMRSGLS